MEIKYNFFLIQSEHVIDDTVQIVLDKFGLPSGLEKERGIDRQTDRQADRRTDRKRDRQKIS